MKVIGIEVIPVKDGYAVITEDGEVKGTFFHVKQAFLLACELAGWK